MNATSGQPAIVRIATPEKGSYLVRCLPPAPPAPGTQVAVNLDYGLDWATVESAGPIDPAENGGKIPGFSLIRTLNRNDQTAIDNHRKLADEMAQTFSSALAGKASVLSARLSLGKARLFLLYRAAGQTDTRAAIREVHLRHGVSVSARQVGTRDEVRILGWAGPCGRACCCCTWQRKYPHDLLPERFKNENSATLNGVCGRVKCCLAFEQGQ